MAQKFEDLEELPSERLDERPPIDLTSAKENKELPAAVIQPSVLFRSHNLIIGTSDCTSSTTTKHRVPLLYMYCRV